MKKIKPWKMMLLATMAVSLFTACSSQDKTATTTSEPVTTKEETKTNTPPDPLGKYADLVTVTEVLGYNPPEDPRTPQGIKPEENAYFKDLKEMLNIEVKYKWTVPSSQFEQKFSLAMASADLPDILELDPKNFEKLKNQDMLADLTDAYKQYASPALKKYMESDGGFAMKTFESDGKQLAIPAFEDPFLSSQQLWIRKDWLDNLNLQAPKTIDELEKVAEAFVKNDPDKNGKNDTYGIAAQKNLFFWGFDLRGFFNGFGAYPSIGDNQSAWIKDSEGKLIPGLIQPEVKAALGKLQSWYQNGILDKEFALKDENKSVEDITAGKVGISYGEWWYPNWPLNLNMDKDPKANWIAVQIPGLEGPGNTLVPKIRSSKLFAVNKKMKNPEAAIKMINFYIEMGNKKYMDQNKAEKGYVYNWFNPRIYNPAQIDTIYTEVNKALDANQTEITLDDENYKNVADVFKATKDFLSGDTSTASRGVNWGQYFSRAAKDGGWGMTRQLKESKAYVNNEFYGIPVASQVEKGTQLDKLMQESFTKIIMGAPLDEFDKFVASWKSLGGDQITQEVNEWYTKQATK
ncbi:extracellular solute-binding protein [Paenibacillus macquariensis]|uniref:Aldouronate transport system substrate-binding protein n=1 Tax=Paenibacillus macquariensis TaxID=948756 RepID=A0ABY1JP56_9BACL|nr:extracellular solute-binding protein [Paenibacillus macquariensis]MEC0092048.1 extracellular solute-binding protein [Paenibacillus macquariensis]OAB37382.1 ABC transporter substrate-binding protein [Paenibacillus macquariensis subsp. macquariensis]SIQ52060.1 putative aldouronate transport system substrate-binding protein [Paenibacillus macquariensis]